MGKFSKIFHHIESKDLRIKYEKKKAAKLKEEKKKKEFRQYLVSTMETKKYSWREGMTTSDVATINVEKAPGDGTVTSVNTIDASSYAPNVTGVFAVGDSFGGNTGTQIRNSGSGSGQDGGFALGQQYLSFQGDGYNDTGHAIRWAGLSAIDSTEVDTLEIDAIVGNDSNGGEDPDAAGEELYLMYKTPAMDQFRFTITAPDGSFAPGKDGNSTDDVIIPLGASGNSGINKYSVEIPDFARAKGTEFLLIQVASSGTGFDNYGITKINFQRKAPMSVVVPLDNPEASSFIRSAPSKSTPKKRKKAVDDKLEASDEYTQAKFGNDFPGREVRVGGDDPFASAKIGDDVEPSPQTKAGVKKAFSAADLKSALGQPTKSKKADPEGKITDIVRSGKVDTQQSSPTRAQTITPKQNTIQVVGNDGEVVNTIPVNTQTQPDQAQSGMSLSDFNTKKEKSKEQSILSKGKPQGPTSNNLITTINETDIESEPDLLGELQNFGTNVSNKIEQSLDNALEYLAKPIPETTKGKGQGGQEIGATTDRYDGVDTSGRYNLNLATELPISIVTGQPREIKISEEGAISMVNSIKSEEQLNNLANFVTFNNSTPTDAENTINPVGKTDGVLGDGWQIQGGSTFNVVTDDAGNITALEIVSNKTLRTTSGGESVERDASGKITKFSDIPDVPLEVVERKTEQLLQNPIVDKFLGGLANVVKVVSLNQGGQGYEFMGQTYNNAWDMMKDNPELGYDEFVTELATVGKNIAETTVQGTASNAVALRNFLQNLEIKSSIDDKGWKPFANNSDIENIGGAHGHVYSTAVIPVENIPEKVLETLKTAQANQSQPSSSNITTKTRYNPEPTPTTYTVMGVEYDVKTGQPVKNLPDRVVNGVSVPAGFPDPPPNLITNPETADKDQDGSIEYIDGEPVYVPPGYDPENLMTVDGDGNIVPAKTEPEFGYEPSNNLNIKANDIIGKSMGDIKNVSEADLEFLIQNGYPVDDIFFGGQTQSPVGDLIALGLSAAAIKLALPLLLKAGGSLVSLVKKEWGMRALTDAAFKTFETTGKMPPWYHWAAHKLLPQPVLNAYAKLLGLKSVPKSILYTGATPAGDIGMKAVQTGILGLSAAVIAKITELMLQGKNKEADEIVVEEMLKLTNKNIDNMGEDEFLDMFYEIDHDYDELTNWMFNSPDVSSSFKSDFKTLEELGQQYEDLINERDSLENDPRLRQAFEAYSDDREKVFNEKMKYFPSSQLGGYYSDDNELNPRKLVPDPDIERVKYSEFIETYKPFIDANKNFDKVSDNYFSYYDDVYSPAYAKLKSFGDTLTYNPETKMYSGTDAEMRKYIKLSKPVNAAAKKLESLSNAFDAANEKFYSVAAEASKFVEEQNEKYDKAMEKVEAERKKLEDEYEKIYDYYDKIYNERFSTGEATQTYQDKLLKDGEDYTPVALYGESPGATVQGFKSLDLKTREQIEEEIDENFKKSEELADSMDFLTVEKTYFKELNGRVMSGVVNAGGSESFKGDDYKPTKPKPSNRRAEASKKNRGRRKPDLGSAGEIGGVDATAAATAAATTKRKKRKRGSGFNESNLYERLKNKSFFNPDDIKPEFPENPPPKLDPKTGKHPEYGKKANRYKKLDPISANSMPPTGDPEIDAVVRKQKTINRIKKMARNK
jgi:hypothetical protein